MQRMISSLEDGTGELESVQIIEIVSRENDPNGRGVYEVLYQDPQAMSEILPAEPNRNFRFLVSEQQKRIINAALSRIAQDARNDAVHRERQRLEQLQREELAEAREEAEEGSGGCDCPSDRDKAGRRCGNRSAWVKAGGRKPSCGRDPVGMVRSGTRKIQNELNIDRA